MGGLFLGGMGPPDTYVKYCGADGKPTEKEKTNINRNP